MSGAKNGGMALAVLAAALGYFVDLINLQMIGMLIGGFFWGVVGDKLGRRFALLATITMYSLANIANAYIVTVEQYAVLRFIAGVGLAGELGAGVTLISEILPRHLRGYGTTVISFLGLVGALTASYVGADFHWRSAYLFGGCAGLVVLALRWRVLNESEMFNEARGQSGQGDLRLLLQPLLLRRFVAVIAVGVPIWYVSALFVNFAPEFGRALGYATPLTVADVLRWQALGLALGSAASGLLSEWLRSRRQVVGGCFAVLAAGIVLLLQSGSPERYCQIMFIVGLAQGYWTAFLTLAAEQFGTNLRATVSTSVPNLVRAMTVPVTLSLQALLPLAGAVNAALLIGAVVFALAALALWRLPETYGRDLNYRE